MKTKDIKSLVKEMNLTGKVLFVASKESDVENLYMATRNLGYAYIILSDEINCYDLINANTVVFEEAAMKEVEEALK
jgi:large subunit ribosomal protein L4